MTRTPYCGKRAVDLLLASLAVAILSPLLLAVLGREAIEGGY